jgi:hypothetical protein
MSLIQIKHAMRKLSLGQLRKHVDPFPIRDLDLNSYLISFKSQPTVAFEGSVSKPMNRGDADMSSASPLLMFGVRACFWD